jgi:hypothetical protein
LETRQNRLIIFAFTKKPPIIATKAVRIRTIEREYHLGKRIVLFLSRGVVFTAVHYNLLGGH